MYKFDQNLVLIEGRSYNLEVMRRRAADYLPNLLSKYFIKCILVKGKPTFTYDYDGFFFHNGEINPELPRWYLHLDKYIFDENIKPVPGFNPDTTTSAAGVDKVYRAISKNFILANDIKKNAKCKFQGHMPIETVSGRDISKSTALMIYCGICKMHDFDVKEACELVGLPEEDFRDNWRWFKEEIRIAINPKDISDERRDKAKRFYYKTSLVLNYLNVGSFLTTELAHLH